jgi:hypothetical protein
MKINSTAALMSASWGLGQIMGSNYEDAGWATIQDMVAAFCDDEENHLDAMVNFLIANHLDDDLREHRWSGLARGYNGPAYAKHGYHIKLRKAYEKWAKIKDTPYDPNSHNEAIKDVITPSKLKPKPKIKIKIQSKVTKFGSITILVGGLIAAVSNWWHEIITFLGFGG